MPTAPHSSDPHARSDAEPATKRDASSIAATVPHSEQQISRRSSQRFQTSDSEFESRKNLFKAGERAIPSQDEEKKSRVGFSSQLEYILAVIGMSVGLGNIWRFPAVVYQNGGGAFLVPYLCMGFLFGLPMLYIDSSVGQFMQNSPSIVFKQYFPAAQGLGWTMAFIVISIGFNYNVPCCWSLIYIVQLIAGRMGYMTSCTNEWNTLGCDNSLFCKDNATAVYFNGSCITAAEREATMFAANLTIASAPEEFFNFHIAKKHASFGFGTFNWMIALSLFVCWAVTAAGLIKGVQSMGKVALVTTILPYLIITILFFRGVTLEGAGMGIRFFLTEPKWEYLFKQSTWKAALAQSCFSLSIGGGATIMMASYNKREHNNYRDCVIILFADTFMSFFGGTAIFAILGSMAHRMGVSIENAVSSPLTLAFVAYPEATSHMPASTLWALLFFVMLFFLGISTMFSFVEGLATCIIDEHPRLTKYHWLVVTAICSLCFLLNLLCFAFQNGYHIFTIFNEFLGLVSMPGSMVLEVVIIMTYYGAPRLFRDIRCMHGLPTNNFSRIFGNLGVYIKIVVTFTAPLLAVILGGIIVADLFNFGRMDGTINGKKFVYPRWTVPFGYMIGALPLFLMPIGALVNYCRFKKRGEPTENLFRISDDHPSVRYNLPEPVSWKELFWPPLKPKNALPSSKQSEKIAVIPDIPASG